MGKLAEHYVEIGARLDKFYAGMAKVEKRMTAIGQKMSAIGKSMTMRVTLPLLAVGTAAVKMGADFDKAMTESLAIMGNVSDAMRKDMAAAALEMSTKTTFAAHELAQAYFYLASAGMNAAQSIKALPVVAKFAQAGAFNLATATDLLTDAQTALGLSSKDAVENQKNLIQVADVLVKANTLANASVQQFSESLTNRAAAALVNVNKKMYEGVAVLAAYADKGVKGQVAGMRLAMMLNALDIAARKNKKAWKENGIALFDAQGEMRGIGDIIGSLEVALGDMTTEQRAATLATLGFNIRTKASILTLMGSSEKIKQWEKDLKSAGGTTEKVAKKQMQAFTNQMIVLKNILVKVGIQIGDILIPIIKDLVDNHIRPAIERFSNLSEGTKKVIIAIAGLVAVAGPLLLVFGKLLTILPLIILQMKKMGFTATGLKASLIGVKGVLSRLPAVGMAAFAGWQIGRLIGQIKICGKSIDEHISGALARAIGWLGLFSAEAKSAAKGTELLAREQKMLAEASEVADRQITSLKEAAKILNEQNFELAIGTGNVAKEQRLLSEASEISGKKITSLADAAKILEKDYKATIIQAGLFTSKSEMLAKASELTGQKITKITDAFDILREHYKKTGDLGSKALNDWAEKATIADEKITRLKESTDDLSGAQERLKESTDDLSGAQENLKESTKAVAGWADKIAQIFHDTSVRCAEIRRAIETKIIMPPIAIEMPKASFDNLEEYHKEWTKRFHERTEELRNKFVYTFSAMANAVSNFFYQLGFLADVNYQNQLNKIDSEYARRRKAIEDSTKSEEEKAKLLERLDKQYEQKKMAVKKKAFESEKKVALVTAAINIAEAITKALPNWILVALVAAAGAVQLAAISARTFPGLEKGGLIPRPMPVMAGHGPRGEIIAQPATLAKIITQEMPKQGISPESAFQPATIMQPVIHIHAKTLDRDTVRRAGELIFAELEYQGRRGR